MRLGGENPEIVRSGEISAAQPPRRSGAPCLAAQPPRRLLGDQNPFARHSEAICNGKLPGFSLPAAPNHTRLVGIWRLHHSIKDGLEKSIPHFGRVIPLGETGKHVFGRAPDKNAIHTMIEP